MQNLPLVKLFLRRPREKIRIKNVVILGKHVLYLLEKRKREMRINGIERLEDDHLCQLVIWNKVPNINTWTVQNTHTHNNYIYSQKDNLTNTLCLLFSCNVYTYMHIQYTHIYTHTLLYGTKSLIKYKLLRNIRLA